MNTITLGILIGAVYGPLALALGAFVGKQLRGRQGREHLGDMG